MADYFCVDEDCAILGGTDTLIGSLAHHNDNGMIDFMVTDKKQPYYSEHCDGLVCVSDSIASINSYTDHTTQLFSTYNLALAADSKRLEQLGPSIRDLRCSVMEQPLLDDCLLYRGVDLSKREMNEMEKLATFFIPSFTSTSVDPSKAYSKSAQLVMKLPYSSKYACSITPALSRFYHQEKEVLIACYSAFRLERVEKVNGKNVIILALDEFLSSMNSLSYTF